MVKIIQIIAFIAVSVAILSGGAYANTSNSEFQSNEVNNTSITSMQGIKYNIIFNLNSGTITVEAINKREEVIKTGYEVVVDSQRHGVNDITIPSNDEVIQKWNVTSSLSVTQDNHQIVVSTFGDNATINFTRSINSTNPGRVPTPQITDVQLGTGTIDGSESAVAYVTVSNPSNQLYGMKLLVHTQETHGSFYGASVRTGQSETFKVELLEDAEVYQRNNGTIAGEARLYVERPRKRDGALDQVEFAGEIDGGTRHWNTSYEPVQGPWREDPYHYENETVPAPGEQTAVDQLGGPAVVAVAILGFVLAGLLVVRRLTS